MEQYYVDIGEFELDRDRLDWLSEQGDVKVRDGYGNLVLWAGSDYEDGDLRAKIDEAVSSTGDTSKSTKNT